MNDMQKKAIFQVKGPVLILAGAGSGKTTVIVNRIANIVKYGNAYESRQVAFEPSQEDIEAMKAYLAGDEERYFDIEDLLSVDSARPWQILAITFTNKLLFIRFIPDLLKFIPLSPNNFDITRFCRIDFNLFP